MSTYTSFVLICPVTALSGFNAFAQQLGHGVKELAVPLSQTGLQPATHYGCHAWADVATVNAWLTDESVPPLSAAQTTALRTQLIMSASTEMSGRAHFDAVLTANRLTKVTEAE